MGAALHPLAPRGQQDLSGDICRCHSRVEGAPSITWVGGQGCCSITPGRRPSPPHTHRVTWPQVDVSRAEVAWGAPDASYYLGTLTAPGLSGGFSVLTPRRWAQTAAHFPEMENQGPEMHSHEGHTPC